MTTQQKSNLTKFYDDYKEVFSSQAGQRVLRDLMSRYHVFGPTLPSGAKRIEDILHAEGERNVVLHILEMLRLHEFYKQNPEMLQQQMELSQTDYRSPIEED